MVVSAQVRRGCGDARLRGSLYLETNLSPWGSPVDDFILDPPLAVDMAGLGLTPVGQKIIADPNGVHHVVDWVGAKHYPNVEDFVQEVRAHGISRRVSKSLDLAKLTKASRLLLLHPRAIITTRDNYWQVIAEREGALLNVRCLSAIRGGQDHRALTREDRPMCSGLWEWDVEGGETLNHWSQSRTIGDTTYACPERAGYSSVDRQIDAPQYEPGYFGAFPIGQFVIVNDPERPAEIDATYARISEKLTAFDLHLEDA